MKATPSSTNIASEIKQSLLSKALAIIGRRQILFKNMNVYSLDQLSKVIQQISQQQALKINSTSIPQNDDLTPCSFDNMMSMSQVKLVPCYQSSVTQQKINQAQSKYNSPSIKQQKKYRKKDKLSIMDLLDDETASRDYLTTCYSNNKQEKQQESAQIQAFRIVKQREHQQMLLKKQSEQKKKRQTPINLNNQRVMYGYDSKIIKLQKMKERQNQSISQMNSSLINLQEDQRKKKAIIDFMSSKNPIRISNKINITQKQAEQEKQKQQGKKTRRNYRTATLQAAPVINIRVNPQTHKETQQAIAIKQPGVKISIQKRQFSANRQNKGMINRKLTRSQYLEIKSNEQIYFRNPNINIVEKLKNRTQERIKTEYIKQDNSPAHFNSGKKYKLSLNTFYNDKPKKDKSKILIHSLQAKAQLLKQVKDKPTLFQTIDDSSSTRQQSLSSIDKYNLLYLKFKGNPPKAAEQRLLNDLQSQSKGIRQGRPALLAYSKSINRENRLIKRIS